MNKGDRYRLVIIPGWDSTAPTIFSATTQDNDGDGDVDRAIIVFDEVVTPGQ